MQGTINDTTIASSPSRLPVPITFNQHKVLHAEERATTKNFEQNSCVSPIMVSRCRLTKIADMDPAGEGSFLQRQNLACKVSWVHG